MGCPAPVDTSTTQLLNLRFRKYLRRGGKNIVREENQEIFCATASPRNDRESSLTSTIWLPPQELNM